jgi:thiamine monophosphate synthase
MIIGFSTHSAKSVEAVNSGHRIAVADLSIRKDGSEPAIGLEGLGKIREAIGDFPLVAIGGIDLDNCRDVFSAGADSVAMISALVSEPSQITTRLRNALEVASN